MSVPHLVALYMDDVQDASEYAGIKYMEIPGYYRPVLWETAVAYAGYGFGICVNFTDFDACVAEARKMPELTVSAVRYGRNALTTSLAILRTAESLWEPDYRHTENFTLGYYSRNVYPKEEDYWSDVRDELRKIMVQFHYAERPSKILLMGEEALNGRFQEVLRESMLSQMDKMPEVHSNDTVFAAAKGTAELAKRAPYYVVPPINWTFHLQEQSYF